MYCFHELQLWKCKQKHCWKAVTLSPLWFFTKLADSPKFFPNCLLTTHSNEVQPNNPDHKTGERFLAEFLEPHFHILSFTAGAWPLEKNCRDQIFILLLIIIYASYFNNLANKITMSHHSHLKQSGVLPQIHTLIQVRLKLLPMAWHWLT